MDNVLNFLNKLKIDKNSYIVVACSGGPDSMFLLKLLYDNGYKVVCAHVNHKVRVESDDEYKFLQKYCNDLGITFEGVELTGFSKGNFENYAREFRYDFFKTVLKKYDSKYLFTAHHGDDLTETVLMRLVRGSSLKGYQGFTKITNREDYKIIRPLVYLTKSQIEYYLNENNIPYVIDSSNLHDDYTRNRFRHHVLPFLKEEDPLVHERFLKFSETIEEVDNFVDRVVNSYLDKIFANNILDINNFSSIDIYIQNKIIYNILEILYPDNLYLVNNNHIEEILKIISSDKPNILITLPNDINVCKEYDKLIFDKNIKKKNEYSYKFEDKLELDDCLFLKVDESDSNSNFVIRLNKSDIKLPLIIRNRRDGDKIKVKNMNGSKKINDIFIDLKISKEKRDSWPLLVDSNNEILWVPGLKKSEFDIQKANGCDIIITYVIKEKDYER